MERGGGAVDLLTTIRTVAETGSTNADLLVLARQGEVEEGLWLRAERQVAGRGRQGRGWSSPVGNLHASTAVRLRPGDPSPPSLALVTGVALAEAVGALVPAAMLKWPNDVMIGTAKLAGILLERAEDAVVIGCGVNVVHAPSVPGRVTASLAEQGVRVTAEALLASLAAGFAHWLERWRHEGVAAVIERWLALAHPAGTRLSVHLPDGSKVEGAFAGLDIGGALRLRVADGSERAIHAGDVFAL